MHDRLFPRGHDAIDALIKDPDRVQVILLKRSARPFPWLKRVRYPGPSSKMTTVKDLLRTNREADFGGYARRVLDVQVVEARDVFEDEVEGSISLDAEDPRWRCRRPRNELGWVVIADMAGTLLTAHGIGPIKTHGGPLLIQLSPGGFFRRSW